MIIINIINMIIIMIFIVIYGSDGREAKSLSTLLPIIRKYRLKRVNYLSKVPSYLRGGLHYDMDTISEIHEINMK